MVRARFFLRLPGGACPLAAGLALAAAGPAWAASSGVETLEAAVTRELDAMRAETEGAPRRLPEVNDPSVRPVSGQTAAQQPPVPPAPTPAQLEVMKQLEEMYKRDGRGPAPPLRLKEAPNTRLPNGKLPGPPPGRTFTTPPALQPVSAPAMSSAPNSLPPAPAQQVAPRKKNWFTSLFSRKPSRSQPRGLSFFDRIRGRSAARTTAETDSAGAAAEKPDSLIEKLLAPFRKDEEPQVAMPGAPPAPPPLPGTDTPARFASQPAPPLTLQPEPPRSLTPPQSIPPSRSFPPSQTFPPAAPAIVSTPADLPPAALPSSDQERDPFSDARDTTTIVITPANSHPLEDAFADIRDLPAPDLTASSLADLDPDFADAPSDDAPDREASEPAIADDESAPTGAQSQVAEKETTESKAAKYAELKQKLAERAGLGGFQGFCPVALRDRRELIDSLPEFVGVYQGRTYELSSAEAKARFDADPTKYAPVNGSKDVVLTARGEADAEGNLQHAVWFKDRLYLFRTAETLKEFNADPAKYSAD